MIALLVGIALAADLHVVRSGETLAGVAAEHGVSEASLRSENQLGPGEEPALGRVLVVPDPAATPADALVLSADGPGQAVLSTGARVPLLAGLVLPAGSSVCTEPESYATLRLAALDDAFRHDEIVLLGGTCLTVEASTVRAGQRNSVVAVERGSVSVRENTTAPGRVSVRGGTALTSGDGGGFRVTVEPEGAARTEALYQPVAVFGARAQLDLAPGFGSRVVPGERPGAPVRLPEAGALLHPADGAELRRPEFTWSAAEWALEYRVEVAARADFSELVHVVDVDGLRWAPERLLLPAAVEGWWWRVSAVDRSGFVGVPSAGRALVVPGPARP